MKAKGSRGPDADEGAGQDEVPEPGPADSADGEEKESQKAKPKELKRPASASEVGRKRKKSDTKITDPAEMYENPTWHNGAHGWTIKYRSGARVDHFQAMSVS